jgi:hypothetical protein
MSNQAPTTADLAIFAAVFQQNWANVRHIKISHLEIG